MKRILALTRYGPLAASTRQRFLQFAPALKEAGFSLDISPLLPDRHTASIRHGQGVGFAHLPTAYVRRLAALMEARKADAVWVQYELLPYVPGWLERLAVSGRPPLVVDFDDAFSHRYDRSASPLVNLFLRDKLAPLLRSANRVIAGNRYLADYLRRWNDSVSIVPTVVDADRYSVAAARGERPLTIGWIGSPTTWTQYALPLGPVIDHICRRHGARFLVVGAGEDAAVGPFGQMELRPWREDREVADIQDMDIGIMPLTDDPWARGKCGYKLIQYMACGLPTIASPVGVNVDLADGDKAGLLATTGQEWEVALAELIADPRRRRDMGTHGRAMVEREYSLQSQAPRIVEMFRGLTGA